MQNTVLWSICTFWWSACMLSSVFGTPSNDSSSRQSVTTKLDVTWRAAAAASGTSSPSPGQPPPPPPSLDRTSPWRLALQLGPSPCQLPMLLCVWVQLEQQREREQERMQQKNQKRRNTRANEPRLVTCRGKDPHPPPLTQTQTHT